MTLTPEQKAKELVERFAPIMPNEDWKEKAKQCALLCVDEILDINSVDKDYDLSTYWEEVKTEIEKL